MIDFLINPGVISLLKTKIHKNTGILTLLEISFGASHSKSNEQLDFILKMKCKS